jgi:hypothetical protein
MIEQTDKDDFVLARGIGNPTPGRLNQPETCAASARQTAKHGQVQAVAPQNDL